ncbi:MAG: 3',5'-cyclic-nucleotide phosphodiesterase [Betaproteobacteria bacterium]|nr:3',5'-cyclic-nucleotide phosphodiesterase [Betaproteobacteria bacterium]MBL8534257.1 3',5'-cyclic-nucleotide phosphodiesterase [Betaproteobacteria bacterium]
MLVRVLGCSGGIGGNLRTTAMLVDQDILIDAGTGVGDLSLTELQLIDHVFLTHSHLDHVAMLPFLVDTVGGMRDRPIVVHATAETLKILRDHIFNWKIWPDFSRIPDEKKPFLRFSEVALGQCVDLDGRLITPVPANHTVPAVGYCIDSGQASMIFTGDTTECDELWQVANRIENLRYLIIETAFHNGERQLAVASKHLWPSKLAEELGRLERRARIYITHLKPGEGAITMAEIEECAEPFNPRMLANGHVFKL